MRAISRRLGRSANWPAPLRSLHSASWREDLRHHVHFVRRSAKLIDPGPWIGKSVKGEGLVRLLQARAGRWASSRPRQCTSSRSDLHACSPRLRDGARTVVANPPSRFLDRRFDRASCIRMPKARAVLHARARSPGVLAIAHGAKSRSAYHALSGGHEFTVFGALST